MDTNERTVVASCWSCPTHAGILEFSRTVYSALVRKVIFRLQRVAASGVYGDDYHHKTLWDEFCHEVQDGPYDPLERAWDATIDPILDTIGNAIPHDEAVLLTIGAIWDLGEDEEHLPSRPGAIPDLIRSNLRRVLIEVAGARDMSRFDPTISA